MAMLLNFERPFSLKSTLLDLFVCAIAALSVYGPAHAIELIPGFQDTQPKFILKNGKQSGICYKILRKIETHLVSKNVIFKYPSQFTPLKRIFREMEIGSTHVYCGAGFNKKRAKKLQYSKFPLYEVTNLIVSDSSSPHIVNGMKDLISDKVRVMALPGTSTEKYLINHDVKLAPINPYNVTNALKLILRGRASHFVYHDIGLLYHIKKYFDVESFKFAANPVRRYYHWMVFSRHVPAETISDINGAIQKLIGTGEIQLIMNKYR